MKFLEFSVLFCINLLLIWRILFRPLLLEGHWKVPRLILVFNTSPFCEINILIILSHLSLITALRRFFVKMHALEWSMAIDSAATFVTGRSTAVQHRRLGALEVILLIGHRGRIRGILVSKATLILLILWDAMVYVINHNLDVFHQLRRLTSLSHLLLQLFWAVSCIAIKVLTVGRLLNHVRYKSLSLLVCLAFRASRKPTLTLETSLIQKQLWLDFLMQWTLLLRAQLLNIAVMLLPNILISFGCFVSFEIMLILSIREARLIII